MAPRRARSGPRGPLDQPGVRHQDQHDVLVTEVLAQVAAGLGPVDQHDQIAEGLGPQPVQLRHAGDLGGQQVGDRAVAGLQLAQERQVAGEREPRVRLGQGAPGGVGDLPHRAEEHRGDQLAAGREAAVQRGIADAGPAGDLIQRRVQAAFGEDGQGRVHELAAVAFGVRAQRLGRHAP